MRKAYIKRDTKETKIELELNLDNDNVCEIDTGCGFLDHMLTLFSSHSLFGLKVKCEGDYNVDFHHTTEDIAICLGKALNEALGDKKGIKRYSSIILPMDEALILCACDISGRSYLGYEVDIPSQKVGEFDTELVNEFFLAFTREANLTIHFKKLSGFNSHHIIEGMFKAFARVIKESVSIDEKTKDKIPSSKGVL